MRINDILTREVRTCTPEMTVAEAAHLMWEGDCGILPVVDGGELVGVVTDRDMYMALATRNTPAAPLKVGAVATQNPATCAPEDDVQSPAGRGVGQQSGGYLVDERHRAGRRRRQGRGDRRCGRDAPGHSARTSLRRGASWLREDMAVTVGRAAHQRRRARPR
jgi:hypothetical protein